MWGPRVKLGGAAVPLALVLGLGGCADSPGGAESAESDTTVTGAVLTTEIYSELINANYGIADPTCGSLTVQIEDGAGEILAVTESDVSDESLSDPGEDVHTLTCTSLYSFSVAEAGVYVISLSEVDEGTTEFATTERTVNGGDVSTVEVPDLEVTWKSVL